MNTEHARQKGIALVLVLWVLTLLSVIAAQFCNAMRTEVNITRNFKESTEAYYIARAGLSRTITVLIRNQLSPLFAREVETELDEEAQVGGPETQYRVNVQNPQIPYGDGSYSVWIENDSGKIDINGADQNMLTMMLDSFDLDESEIETIVDSILDWRDADDFHRINGAESDYYQSLSKPYACKNADFDAVEELLLVKGVTPEIFHGGLDQIVTVQGAGGRAGSEGGIELPSMGRGRLRSRSDLGAQTLRLQGGNSQINVNAAPRRVLMALPQMTAELADAIAAFRKERDFKSLTEVQEVVGGDVFAAISPYIGFEESPFYTVHARGTVTGSAARRRVTARLEVDPRYDTRYRIVGWIDG